MHASPFSRRHGIKAAATAALALSTSVYAGSSAQAADPTGAARPAGGRQLHVMSFNLRYASDTTPNSWAERRPVMRELLRREAPHLIGTQEGLYEQLRDIEADLGPRYDAVGTGREGGSHGEFATMFYDTTRLDLLEFDHFWLSETPNVIASKGWDAAITRMATWARFKDLRTGTEFYALNTHFDHVGQKAREHSAELISERLRALNAELPRVVLGDFNAAAHANPAYDTLLNGGTLVDTWETAEKRSALYATFHGYKPLTPDGARIDWILTSPSVRTRHAAINTFSKNGQFPSDHLPVQAVIEI
ncbi:endonuclease/exonuclease/phosphatase family protein [Streptomyces pathocidini]|uniref:Endonuclease/exonuclease/phosphatase family protein n=1 Tax=Streptomyces pathocidini TaxID=1650571 RepID=A0ABW7UQT9_9ACTN|nr:endonuclease/exonuclease/phosphatase family protein [Streptomyces pathocidini]